MGLHWKRKCCPEILSSLRDWRSRDDALPNAKALGYSHLSRKRAEHLDYEPDLNFKKAKAEADSEGQALI